MEATTYERVKIKETSKRTSLLKKIVVSAVFVACLSGLYHLFHQPWFAFGAIYITGAEKLRREEILAVTGLKEPINLFLLDRLYLRNTLINDIRIKDAEITFRLPNILHIIIREEQPLCYIASNYGYAALNARGEIMNASKTVKDAGAPLLSGFSLKNEFVGDRADYPAVRQVLAFLSQLDDGLKNDISEINLTKEETVTIFDLSGRRYLLGKLAHIEKKAGTFAAIVKKISEKNSSVDFVDLSYNTPYIKIKR